MSRPRKNFSHEFDVVGCARCGEGPELTCTVFGGDLPNNHPVAHHLCVVCGEPTNRSVKAGVGHVYCITEEDMDTFDYKEHRAGESHIAVWACERHGTWLRLGTVNMELIIGEDHVPEP